MSDTYPTCVRHTYEADTREHVSDTQKHMSDTQTAVSDTYSHVGHVHTEMKMRSQIGSLLPSTCVVAASALQTPLLVTPHVLPAVFFSLSKFDELSKSNTTFVSEV